MCLLTQRRIEKILHKTIHTCIKEIKLVYVPSLKIDSHLGGLITKYEVRFTKYYEVGIINQLFEIIINQFFLTFHLLVSGS